MPKKSLPSERIAREIEEMAMEGVKSVSKRLIRQGALTIQRVLELEAEEFTGRGWCERKGEGSPIYRNG